MPKKFLFIDGLFVWVTAGMFAYYQSRASFKILSQTLREFEKNSMPRYIGNTGIKFPLKQFKIWISNSLNARLDWGDQMKILENNP